LKGLNLLEKQNWFQLTPINIGDFASRPGRVGFLTHDCLRGQKSGKTPFQKQGVKLGQNRASKTALQDAPKRDTSSMLPQVVPKCRIAGPVQQRGNTMPDLSERQVDVSGPNAVSQEPAPKPPLNAPAPQSIQQQIVQNVTQLTPMPAITVARDPVRLQQWAKPSIPQTALHLPNVVKPSGNSLQPPPTPQPILAPIKGSISISAAPTSVAPGGSVTLTIVASGGKSVRVSGAYLNGKSGPGPLGPWNLPSTGGILVVNAPNVTMPTSATFTATLSGAGGGGSSLPPTVSASCPIAIT
jgi:hypothetical protein